MMRLESKNIKSVIGRIIQKILAKKIKKLLILKRRKSELYNMNKKDINIDYKNCEKMLLKKKLKMK